MKITETVVRFNLNRKKFTEKISFKIYHNLPEVKGMSIEGAIDAWLARTKIFTAQSLCNYIMDKEIDKVFALTEEHFLIAKKDAEDKDKSHGI
jgi:hypothetical protein